MLDGSLFALKYLPPNEESRSSGRQARHTSNRPALSNCYGNRNREDERSPMSLRQGAIASEQAINRLSGLAGIPSEQGINREWVCEISPVITANNSGTTAGRRTLKCTVGQPEEMEMAATAHL